MTIKSKVKFHKDYGESQDLREVIKGIGSAGPKLSCLLIFKDLTLQCLINRWVKIVGGNGRGVKF